MDGFVAIWVEVIAKIACASTIVNAHVPDVPSEVVRNASLLWVMIG